MPPPLYLIAGARPNFVKLAPLVRALQAQNCLPFEIVHTGQHYDHAMSAGFFETLGLRNPEINLEVGSGSQGAQTARILERCEQLLLERPGRAVVVFGDVNSTAACALAAAKLQVPVVHVEAGLRSFDRSMPEEINRVVTDVLADLLLVSEPSGVTNLAREGISPEKIHLVGNIMIDSLEYMLPQALQRPTLSELGLQPGSYALLTMHRPSNVDQPEVLRSLMGLFTRLSEQLPIIFPVHPRTRQRLAEADLLTNAAPRLRLLEPLDYLDSLCLQKHARLVLTDSGGMQEETTHLGIPCLTLRENTERPVTLELGTSTLVGHDPLQIEHAFQAVLAGQVPPRRQVPLWDGHAAERMAEILRQVFGEGRP